MNRIHYKTFDLQRRDGNILVAKAHQISDKLYIIGHLKQEIKQIDCCTLPMTKEIIENGYDLKFINESTWKQV